MRYLLKRFATVFVTLFLMSIVVFAAGRLSLGSASISAVGFFATPEAKQQFAERFHLDRPMYEQYIIWLGNAFRGDLGQSLITKMPVTEILLSGLAVTASLAVGAALIAIVFGIVIGTFGGLYPRSAIARLLNSGSAAVMAVPNFWLGLLLIMIFSLTLRILPAGGYSPLSAGIGSYVAHMVLPWLALAAAPSAIIARVTQARVMEVSQYPYIIAAKARGLIVPIIWHRYLLRNAISETLTVAGIQMGYMLGGAFVLEVVFDLPGVGQIALRAVNQSDYPILQGVTIYAGLAFLLINLFVDALQFRLDPRLRTSEKT